MINLQNERPILTDQDRMINLMQQGTILRGMAFLFCFVLLVATATGQEATTVVNADVWADNWFVLYVDGRVDSRRFHIYRYRDVLQR